VDYFHKVAVILRNYLSASAISYCAILIVTWLQPLRKKVAFHASTSAFQSQINYQPRAGYFTTLMISCQFRRQRVYENNRNVTMNTLYDTMPCSVVYCW